MYCEQCQRKRCLNTGKPCKRMELYLKEQNIHKASWIRPYDTIGAVELPFSYLGSDYNGDKEL